MHLEIIYLLISWAHMARREILYVLPGDDGGDVAVIHQFRVRILPLLDQGKLCLALLKVGGMPTRATQYRGLASASAAEVHNINKILQDCKRKKMSRSEFFFVARLLKWLENPVCK
jgi:hypothetical protein